MTLYLHIFLACSLLFRGGGGGVAIDTFDIVFLAIFQIIGVNVEKIKRRIVQKVCVIYIRC